MTDFSHLLANLYEPHLVADFEARNEPITDEILLEIFNRIAPPLLEARESAVVVAILSRKRGRRPCRGVPSLQWLARRIAALDREDVHEVFLRGLSNRIASPKVFTEVERSRRFSRPHMRQDRDMLIRGLYREFYRSIENSPAAIEHDVLGKVDVPLEIQCRGTRAAKMTHDVLRNRLKMMPPAISTIVKIGSKRYYIT